MIKREGKMNHGLAIAEGWIAARISGEHIPQRCYPLLLYSSSSLLLAIIIILLYNNNNNNNNNNNIMSNHQFIFDK